MTKNAITIPKEQTNTRRRLTAPSLPLPVWMILATLVLLLAAGLPAEELVAVFNAGWGAAIGEFALILIPSFTLAAAIDRIRVEAPPLLAVGLSPLAAAGMVCPDTAYAALTPMNKRRRLEIAFGSYAGFKLLFPAGPLIVATSIGVSDTWLLITCFALFLPVYAAGLAFARFVELRAETAPPSSGTTKTRLKVLIPFGTLCALLALGVSFDVSQNVVVGFLVNPKGALMCAAGVALAMVPACERRVCLETGLSRSGSLLVIIGAASALSAAVTLTVPVGIFFAGQSGSLALLSLFALTASFKIVQGSSMSTFAAVSPIAAPIVMAAGLPPVAAVLAICLGSFVAILPNDSYYWLVRKSALSDMREGHATAILAGGSILQATVGLAILLAAYWTFGH